MTGGRGARARLGVSRLWPLAALAAAALWADPAAADSVSIQVQIIYATKSEAGVDPKLDELRPHFAPLGYRGYRRLGGDVLRVGPGAVTMSLPDGRRLDVYPKNISPEAADLRLAIYEGGRKVLASDIRLVPGGQAVLMGGLKHGGGVLLLAIQAMR